MPWPFLTRSEQLRREASDWIARLNGPSGEADRAEFERWYASSPDHAAAYDRVACLFEAAAGARRPANRGTAPPVALAAQPPRSLRYGFVAVVACAALLAFVVLSARTAAPPPNASQQVATFTADVGGNRQVLLADGSQVLLAPGSSIEVALGSRERRLRLKVGEGRFSVAHDARPFIVEAMGTEVVARGTQFVVRLSSRRTTVRLIEGRVDVSYAPQSARPEERRLARLEPGEALVVEIPSLPARGRGAAASRAGSAAAPLAMLQFDDMPLDHAAQQVNRTGDPQIRLGDPVLARLRITGAFRAGNTSGFAESVAAALSLELERGADGSLWLHPRGGAAAAK